MVGISGGGVRSTLPADFIVFSATLPSPDFSLVTEFDGYFLAGASSFDYTTTIPTSSTWTTTTSSAGGHIHNISTYGYNSWTQTQVAPFTYITSAGTHSHSLTIRGFQEVQNYVTLKPYVSNGNGVITSGCIIGWAGTSTVLPSGWAFCNGSTVRGVTTPNLNGDKFIKLSSTSHGANYTGVDGIGYGITNITTGASHSHAGGSGRSAGNFTSGNQHNTFGWSHSHYISSTTDYTLPLSKAISFIMYIP
jgi:hypothetical protein